MMAILFGSNFAGLTPPNGHRPSARLELLAFLLLAGVAVGCGFFALRAVRSAPAGRTPPAVPRPTRPRPVSPLWMACGLAGGLGALVLMLFFVGGRGLDTSGFMVVCLVGALLVVGAGVVARLTEDHRRRHPRPAVRPNDAFFRVAVALVVFIVGSLLMVASGVVPPAFGALVMVVGAVGVVALGLFAAFAGGPRTAAAATGPAGVPIFAAGRMADGRDQPGRPPELPPPLPRACPKCGAAIAADAPQGLCPRCLMQAAFSAAVSPLQTAAYTGPYVPPPIEDVAEFFPHLEVLGLVGQGGMGAVYKARQPNLDRVVALKLIRPREDDPTFAERFSREARALAKLSHPNIVTVHEFGEAGGSQYLLMEFVDGVTLREAMRAKALSPAAALKVIGQICDALQFAHEKGVVHRDVKPENILLGKDGAVKIADFGLAKVVDPDGLTLTRTHQAMGTPHYMAPEQWEKPAEVDHRADIYALGVVFYELLTGELPLGRFDPPSQKVQIDVRIDEVVLKALAKEPGRRYQAVVDVRTDLETIGRYPYHRCPSGRVFREYKSKATFLGWPLVHVVSGLDPITGRPRTAKGWLAIADVAAVGGVAISGVAAVGGVAISGCLAAGVVSLTGVLAVGLVALGGMAVGGLAVGGIAAGFFAVGGIAAGFFAVGGVPVGWHTLGTNADATGFLQAVREFFTLQGAPPPPPPVEAPLPPPPVQPPAQ
jgi:tRNA A-37 threonylcarbamoyl transferase component Bud32